MFAVLLSDKMTPFYNIIGSFPTVFFTILCLLSAIYWLIAMLGAIDLDVLDVPEADGLDVDGGDGLVNGAGAVLIKFGLNGVPLIVVVSLIGLFGWILSFYSVHLLSLNSWVEPIAIAAKLGVFLASLYFSVLATAFTIRPLRKLFHKMDVSVEKKVLGKTAIVRTSRVDGAFGEAEMADGGAGLILKVRSFSEEVFAKGDRVVPLEYMSESNTYRIVSEKEFLNN